MATIGETLRAARERRGLSLSEASRLTRIAPRFLVALEEDDYGALPAPVYARGFLRSYATLLGLDPEPLVAALRAQMERPPDVVGFEESERFAVEAGSGPPVGARSRWGAGARHPEEHRQAWGADILREEPPPSPAWGWVALLLGVIVLAAGVFVLALSRCG
ncbi:MAG: helix-turn-helix domain-containing protein [Chloroflexota bacterium]|nr:helix-turn-helix domain-containing protein [Dehalococcoidia bacterium]MDW8047125.1 helix-turn-helix domain-containing protein [Chloroflexota bacterium]